MPAALSPVNMRTPRSPRDLSHERNSRQRSEDSVNPLGGAHGLAVAVVVGAYGDHRRHVLVGGSPQPPEVYPVHVDVGVAPLERADPPLHDGGDGHDAEVRDGDGGHAESPEHLAHVLDPPGRDAGEVHLNHRLPVARLAPAVALDDRGGEPYALELGHADLTSPEVVASLRS